MSRPVLPPVLLGAYGLAFAAAALGRGVLAFDDHPGQLYRLWHVLRLGLAPWRWNPGWWAGYPELQFYPPGFSYAGVVVHSVTLGALGPETVYQVLLWVTYILPGAATYALLARGLGDRWLALPGAFLALALSAEVRSGVEEGLRWGLVAARLGWGLLPVLGLSLMSWLEGRPRLPLGAALLLAAVILVHPAHLGTGIAMVVLAAAFGPGSRWRRFREAALVVGLSLGLAGFWLLPLLAHLSMALPLAWGDASLAALGRRLVDYPLLAGLVVANLAAWLGRRAAAPSPAARWLVALAPASLALVVVDAMVATPLGLRWLPADRVADGLALALILGASVGLGVLARCWPRAPVWTVSVAAILLSAALGGGGNEPALSLWPRARQWPTYEQVVRGTRLRDLWQALAQAPPGRVLFIRSSVPLEYRPEWWRAHSHITALTPVTAGRQIVNGTFTHPSPVAGFLYTGSDAHAPVGRLVEQGDGATLFGRPLETIDPGYFGGVTAALRISAVVALDEDAGRLGFLGGSAGFRGPTPIGPFLLFTATHPPPAPAVLGPGRLSVLAAPSASPEWRTTGVAYSPLWHARSAEGPVPTRRGAMGLLEVGAPASASVAVELSYEPGGAEWAGLIISLGGLAILLGVVARRHRADRAMRPR